MGAFKGALAYVGGSTHSIQPFHPGGDFQPEILVAFVFGRHLGVRSNVLEIQSNPGAQKITAQKRPPKR
jgi:hypothetical protein